MWQWFSGPLGLWSDRALSHLHLHLVFTCVPAVNIEIRVLSNHAQLHNVTAWRDCGRKSPILPGHSKQSLCDSVLGCCRLLMLSSAFLLLLLMADNKVIFLFFFFYSYLFLAVQHLPPPDHLCQRFARLHHHPGPLLKSYSASYFT